VAGRFSPTGWRLHNRHHCEGERFCFTLFDFEGFDEDVLQTCLGDFTCVSSALNFYDGFSVDVGFCIYIGFVDVDECAFDRYR